TRSSSDGNDGWWSSFRIRVGNPAQDMRVLVSTLVAETWVVARDGCTDDANEVPNCADTRGDLFNRAGSTTWKDQKNWPLVAEQNLGFTCCDDAAHFNAGNYGFDTLGISSKSGNITLDQQVVAAIATKDFYLGNLGLSPRAVNQNLGPSFLKSLKDQNKIPSLSYGYTAGAVYRSNTTASLTLGGHDVSRFTPNDVFFGFSPTQSRELVVGVQSISFSNGPSTTPLLPGGGIYALIDSTVPDIWLPLEACTAFEKAFGISWDPIRARYLVNETEHDALLEQNANVTFRIGNSKDNGPSMNIVLPYQSFDQQLGPPILKKASRSFPLRQANDASQYTLGRTFLQEAFLTADYERGNFSVSQCVFPPPANSQIVPIPATSSTSTSTSTGAGTGTNPSTGTSSSSASPSSSTAITITHNSSNGLPTSAIAGIAIAMVALATILAGIAIYMLCKRSRKKKNGQHQDDVHNREELPATQAPTKSDTGYESSRYGHKLTSVSVAEVDGHELHPINHTGAENNYSNQLGINHGKPAELHAAEARAEMESPEPPDRFSGTTFSTHIEIPSPNLSTQTSQIFPSPPEPYPHRSSSSRSGGLVPRTRYPFPSPDVELEGGHQWTASPFQSPVTRPATHRAQSPGAASYVLSLNSPRFELDIPVPSPEPSPNPESQLLSHHADARR
ncbi:MAG: hypothetical protein Q9187_007913, partial [Circinaria calcarea]